MPLTGLVVRLAGGFWPLRERALAARTPIERKVWAWFYRRHLERRGSYIPLSARFAGPPVFPHGPYGIFVSQRSVIGRDCVIFQHVTIGSNNLPDSPRRGSPVLGDGCLIGAGAAIIGAVRLGNGVRVGANCAVVKDVPDDAVVVAQPARVIRKEALDNRFESVAPPSGPAEREDG